MSKIVRLKLEEAVQRAAAQNLDRDHRNELISLRETRDPNLFRAYEEEAYHLLTTTGENYLPEEPDTEHIYLDGFVEPQKA